MQASLIMFDRGYQLQTFTRDPCMGDYIIFHAIWKWKKNDWRVALRWCDINETSGRLRFGWAKNWKWKWLVTQTPLRIEG